MNASFSIYQRIRIQAALILYHITLSMAGANDSGRCFYSRCHLPHAGTGGISLILINKSLNLLKNSLKYKNNLPPKHTTTNKDADLLSLIFGA